MNSKKINQIKGITLIALVITIIILLIIAGISIASLTGNGLFEKAQLVVKETKYANAAEKVALAVNASYDTTGKINDNLLKENVNKIDGLDKKVETVTFDLKIVVDGFEFTISEYGKITGEKTEVATLPDNTKDTNAGTEVKLPSDWGTQNVSYIKVTDGTEVTTLETVATVYAVSDGNNNTVPVPKGFYYVGGTKDSGVVISDDSRDKNKYAGKADVPDGAIYKDDGTAKRIIYNTDGTVKSNEFTVDEEKIAIVGNQFVWVPCNVSGYTKYNWGYQTGTWDTSTNTAEKSQIEKYGGFYIGRYEAGTSNITFAKDYTLAAPTGTSSWSNGNYTSSKVTSGQITSKAGEIPYFHADYTTAVEMSEKMFKDDKIINKSVTSGLITGTMWDVALNFVSSETDKNVSNASNSSKYTDLKISPWGNYNSDTSTITGSNITYTEGKGKYIEISSGSETGIFTKSDKTYHYGMRTSGWSEGAKKKNIYDMAGNLWEWTQECASSADGGYYVIRGGCFGDTYNNSGIPVCYRNTQHTKTLTYTYLGFRVGLYIK